LRSPWCDRSEGPSRRPFLQAVAPVRGGFADTAQGVSGCGMKQWTFQSAVAAGGWAVKGWHWGREGGAILTQHDVVELMVGLPSCARNSLKE